MTVDEEFEQRNAEYMKQLNESLAFHTKQEVMEEWGMTDEEYEEHFGNDE